LLATNLRQQAAKMAAEAKGLLAESDLLLKQAAQMDPATIAEKPKATKKSAVAEVAPVVETVAKTKKTRAKVSA